MKKAIIILSIALLLSMFATVCIASSISSDFPDYSDLPTGKIYEVLDRAITELANRNCLEMKDTINYTRYYIAENAMMDYLQMEEDDSDYEFTSLGSTYGATVRNGIRVLCQSNRIVKLSVRFDENNPSATSRRLYLVISILEGGLYAKQPFDNNDMYNAATAAKDIVNASLSILEEYLAEIYPNKTDGFHLAAASGLYNYGWECLNETVWLSSTFAPLPEGIR